MNIFTADFFTEKSRTNYLTEDTTIRQALEKFDYHKFSVVPIADDRGFFIGIIKRKSILNFLCIAPLFSKRK